ncbi:programmed cell death 1 ligand 1 [Pelodytes ibericus]
MDLHRHLAFVILFWNHWHVLTLFTVQAVQTHYTAELGTEVSMACHFKVGSDIRIEDLTVYWEHIDEGRKTSEVAKLFKGHEEFSAQHKAFKGRVKMLKDELAKGNAVIQISNVSPRDSGQYRCIIASKGSDYTVVNLDVQAAYRKINTYVTDILSVSGERMKELKCQSVGYPKAEVTWLNEQANLSALVNTSYTRSADHMFNVTSVIRISSASNKTFTCSFWNKAFQEATSSTFTIPDEHTTTDKGSYLPSIIIPLMLTAVVVLGFVIAKVYSSHKKKNNDFKGLPGSNRLLKITPIQANTKKSSEHNQEIGSLKPFSYGISRSLVTCMHHAPLHLVTTLSEITWSFTSSSCSSKYIVQG